MLKCVLVSIFLMSGVSAMAQDNDTLFAIKKDAKLAVKYTVKPGENARMLANRFYITESVLANANDEHTIKKPSPGDVLYIPVTGENYMISKPSLYAADVSELYYHVAPKDEIGILSTYLGITKADLRSWNSMKGNTLITDQPLFVGWVKMMQKDTANVDYATAYPVAKKKPAASSDTAKAAVAGGLDSVYNRQTNEGLNVLTEKGTAVFFEKPGKNNIYYAFHNETPRGSIIKVHNPGSGKTIYVKVLGPIPGTKLYANSIIGICTAAKEALGITDNKAWCELSYAAN